MMNNKNLCMGYWTLRRREKLLWWGGCPTLSSITKETNINLVFAGWKIIELYQKVSLNYSKLSQGKIRKVLALVCEYSAEPSSVPRPGTVFHHKPTADEGVLVILPNWHGKPYLAYDPWPAIQCIWKLTYICPVWLANVTIDINWPLIEATGSFHSVSSFGGIFSP